MMACRFNKYPDIIVSLSKYPNIQINTQTKKKHSIHICL